MRRTMRKTMGCPDMFRKRLQELYTHHRGYVQRACKRYVQNHEDADDLTVEVLLKAAGGVEKPAGCVLSNTRTWLYRVAINHCLDHIRRRNWRKERMLLYAAHQSGFGTMDPGLNEDPSLPGEWNGVLGLLWDRLNPEDRRILHLLFDAGMRQEAVARTTGVSRGTVARKMARIRNLALEIRHALDAQEPEFTT